MPNNNIKQELQELKELNKMEQLESKILSILKEIKFNNYNEILKWIDKMEEKYPKIFGNRRVLWDTFLDIEEVITEEDIINYFWMNQDELDETSKEYKDQFNFVRNKDDIYCWYDNMKIKSLTLKELTINLIFAVQYVFTDILKELRNKEAGIIRKFKKQDGYELFVIQKYNDHRDNYYEELGFKTEKELQNSIKEYKEWFKDEHENNFRYMSLSIVRDGSSPDFAEGDNFIELEKELCTDNEL